MKKLALVAMILSAFAVAVAFPEIAGWVLVAIIFGTVGALLRHRRAPLAAAA